MVEFQPFERGDHLVAAGELRASRVRPELALAAEPHHDDAGKNAQHELRDDDGNEKRGTVPALHLEHHAVDEVPDDARQEDHEGIDHPLNQRKRHHVAIGDMGHFMTEHRLGFVLRHIVE